MRRYQYQLMVILPFAGVLTITVFKYLSNQFGTLQRNQDVVQKPCNCTSRKTFIIPTDENLFASQIEYIDSVVSPETKANDSKLIDVVRKYFLHPPSTRMLKHSLPLFMTKQAKAVLDIMRNKRNGFFIECGGLDGERSSNTIMLEKAHGWTGLLIEMDPSWFKQLSGKNRKSYSINSCISIHAYPEKASFYEHNQGQGQLAQVDKRPSNIRKHFKIAKEEVYCFPLLTMLLALKRTRVDYFSLDVEGFEMEILRSIPWSQVTIDVISVEFVHGKNADEYVKYMESVGYRVHSKIHAADPKIKYYADDFMFVRNNSEWARA